MLSYGFKILDAENFNKNCTEVKKIHSKCLVCYLANKQRNYKLVSKLRRCVKFQFLTEVLRKLELLRDVTVCGCVSSPDVLKDHGAFTLDVDALSSPSNTVLHLKELNLWTDTLYHVM